MTWIDVGPAAVAADKPLHAGIVDVIRNNLDELMNASAYDIQCGINEGLVFSQVFGFGVGYYEAFDYLRLPVLIRNGKIGKRKIKVSFECYLSAATTAYLKVDLQGGSAIATVTATSWGTWYDVEIEIPGYSVISEANAYPADTMASALPNLCVAMMTIGVRIPTTPGATVRVRGLRFTEVLD